MKTDAEIQQAVLRELKWDTRVSETEVGVEVDHGIVTLTGTVESFAKRRAAQEAAHRVAAVHDVANDIQVKVPGILGLSDTEIALAVRRSLEWHVMVPEDRITSTVSHGVVMLEGTVDNWRQRDDAERAVRHLGGVRDVLNEIQVAGPSIEATEIQEEIEAALERRAEREAKHIQVQVRDGRVVLTGTVQSWPEKRAVLGAAHFTAGVRAVEDHLIVSPSR
jgi:osmotically-inducible protein OsmY